MFTRVTLFVSPRDEDNQTALADLQKLKTKGIALEIAPEGVLLSHVMRLPSILTDDGLRAHGVDGIKRFAEVQSRKIQSSRTWAVKVLSFIGFKRDIFSW